MFMSLLLDVRPKSLLVLLHRYALSPGTQEAAGAIGAATNHAPGPAPGMRVEPGAVYARDRRERVRGFAVRGLVDMVSASPPRTGKSASQPKAGEGPGDHSPAACR